MSLDDGSCLFSGLILLLSDMGICMVDRCSFHPSQEAMYLISKLLWKHLSEEHPDVLGPVNPNNGVIKVTVSPILLKSLCLAVEWRW